MASKGISDTLLFSYGKADKDFLASEEVWGRVEHCCPKYILGCDNGESSCEKMVSFKIFIIIC